ncbi:adenosine deaminase [Vibrio maerlii]|uniref:adenosine deaminase n=1 Tax=Vibrio maerlii TaxID=2231648 RepID=UPI000E3E522C|nr:adenosine deaminase [Vibrio maerlii]
MNYQALPKIDLHCHLDGSVRPQTLIDLAKEQSVKLESYKLPDVTEAMIAPEDCPNLIEYLKRFDIALSVMQKAEAIERISYELFADAAEENVKYMEVRFGPLLHLQQGLSIGEVIESAIKGMKRAEDNHDIRGNYILSIVKGTPEEQVPELIEIGAQYLDKGVVAIDLAGAELPHFASEYQHYIDSARAKGYRVTIHAGEQGDGNNVLEAITLLGAERIGHGIGIKDHPQAYEVTKKEEVALETCPTSNIQTKAVQSLEEHPARAFFDDKLNVTINTDNRTVSNTTMTDEVRKTIEAFNFSEQEYLEVYKISVLKSFATDEVKQELLKYA